VGLSWTVPANGGSPITNYKVYRGTSPGAEGTTPLATLASSATSYDDNAVTNATPYYYQVAAVNAIGETRSAERSVTPSASGYATAPQGNWVNTYGSQGYDLAAWNNGGSDLTSLGTTTVTLDQGARYCWVCSTTDVRALQSPDQTPRRAATYYDGVQVRVHLTFSSAYSGTLHLYALDWDTTARRESVIVDDGSGPQTVTIVTDFSQGAWMSFPVNVASGGTVAITVNRTAGINAVLSGIFLN